LLFFEREGRVLLQRVEAVQGEARLLQVEVEGPREVQRGRRDWHRTLLPRAEGELQMRLPMRLRLALG
jgi:hypothetical protein